MTDFYIADTRATALNLGAADDALITPTGVIATSLTAVDLTAGLSGTPSLTVLGTVWSGGTQSAVEAAEGATIIVGPAGSITCARGGGIDMGPGPGGTLAHLSVLNAGTIAAHYRAIHAGTSDLDLDNTGLIHGARDAAVEAHGFGHRIVNDGRIIGADGIDAFATSVTHIVNTGHIAGARAIVVRGASAEIENRGTLSGSVSMLVDNGVFDGRGGGAAEVYGGDGVYLMRGGSEGDLFTGGTGVDDLRGGAGDDLLLGAAGDDLLLGGTGDDTIEGGAEADDLRGGEGDDSLTGDGGADILTGGLGDDTLIGWTEDDTLDGGAGNDRIDGGDGIDTLIFRSAAGVTVDLGRSVAQATGQGLDTILGIENVVGSGGGDRLTGSDAVNRLDGGAGADTLSGGNAGDRLVGGADGDRLNGGAGRDLFLFRTGDGSDVIEDFRNGLDRMDLRGLATGLAEVTVAPSGANTILSAGDVRITLLGVSAGRIDAGDFLF